METPSGSRLTPARTALSSPKRRFRCSPSVGMAGGMPSEQLFEGNDDEAEKQKRRMEIKNNAFRSPANSLGTPRRAGGRRSGVTGGNGMDQGQLAEHYANCIKLSSENKINAKNAFGLHLIDYMADMLHEQSGLTNFQVAGCTLDASAKIYSGRVDSIYADAYKMLGGLGAQDRRPNREEGGEDGAGEGDGENRRQSKAKKKMRHSHTVEQNIKNLNVNKFDLEFEVDPLFQKTSATFDEGGPRGLLLNQLAMSSETCEVVLDSNTVVMPTIGEDRAQATPTTTTHDPCMLDLTNMRDHLQQLHIDGLEICSEFVDFTFMNGGSDELHSINGTWSVSDLLAKTTPSKARAQSEFCYDANASSGDDDCFGDAGAVDFDGGDGNGFPTSVGEENVQSAGLLAEGNITGPAKLLSDVVSSGSGDRMVVVDSSVPGSDICLSLAAQPGEYSYFDQQCLANWAGPKHWRIRPRSKESSATSETGGEKTKEKRKAFRIDFEATFDAKKAFVQTKATTLTKAALAKRNGDLTTLPEDLHFDFKQLTCLFIKPKWSFVVVARKEGTEHDGDGGLPWYNYNNARDCEEFCPPAETDNGDDDDVGTQGGFTLANNSLCDTFVSMQSGGDITHMPSFLDQTAAEPSMLAGNNLVAQPRMVQRVQIDYAKSAKRVDVKKLKASMWFFMTRPPAEKENIGEEGHDEMTKDSSKSQQSGVQGEQEFTNVYKTLPGLVSHNMAKNMSIPIVFVCLLHLANEKVLKIEGNSQRNNLYISQDRS